MVITGCLNFTNDNEEEARGIVENPVLDGNSSLVAYPNPVDATLNVEFTQSESFSTILVSDLLGRLVQQQKVEANGTGLQKASLDVSQLQPGSYLLQVLDGKARRYVQFVKVGN